MRSDPAAVSGRGLGREEDGRLGAGDFLGDKEPTEEAEEGAREVEVQQFTCSAVGLSALPPPFLRIP